MKKPTNINTAWLMSALWLLAVMFTTPVCAQQLRARLELVDSANTRSEFQIRFTLQNEGDQTVQVLRWHTPLEGFRSQLFEVTCSGRLAPYRGPVVKRLKPSEQDYATLQPGRSLNVTLDLAGAYDLGQGGDCEVTWHGELLDVAVGAKVRRRSPRKFEGYSLPQLRLSTRLASSGVTYTSCSRSEETTLGQALPTGATLAQQAENYLDGVPSSQRSTDERYITWFGSYSSGNYSTVSSRYGQIATAAGNSLTLDCSGSGQCSGVSASCLSGDIAFTCAGGASKTIWLCNGFWSLPATGEDSQAGSMVHELSHWYGTSDHRYGCKNCQSLASSSPSQAITNADNTEYFAENFGLVCK